MVSIFTRHITLTASRMISSVWWMPPTPMGLAVILDVVYNHLGPAGNYLARFGPYFTQRYATPWGQAINFDGAE